LGILLVAFLTNYISAQEEITYPNPGHLANQIGPGFFMEMRMIHGASQVELV